MFAIGLPTVVEITKSNDLCVVISHVYDEFRSEVNVSVLVMLTQYISI